MSDQSRGKGRRTAAATALKKLSKLELHSGPTAPYVARLRTESDRGAILLIASYLEDGLQTSITHLLDRSGARDRAELFGFNGPLSTFSSKIMMADALGIITPFVRQLIDLVRATRNAAAHLQHEVDFDTSEVRQAALALMDEKRAKQFDKAPKGMVREAFTMTGLFLQMVVLSSVGSDQEANAACGRVLAKAEAAGGFDTWLITAMQPTPELLALLVTLGADKERARAIREELEARGVPFS